MKKIYASLKTAFALIGSVIGAGFITGREIVKFFYGYNPLVAGGVIFIMFFALFYLLLSKRAEHYHVIFENSNLIIYIFSLLTLSAMLAATDSLAEDMGYIGNIPVFSIAILVISIIICKDGIGKVEKFNLVLVPIMLIVTYIIVAFNLFSGKIQNNFSQANICSCVGYVCMNVLLTQPFIFSMKTEEKKYSPLCTAFFVSVILSITVFLFLLVLPQECIFFDIPILRIVSPSGIAFFVVSFLIAIGIITTLVGTLYPLMNVVGGKKRLLWVCGIAVLVFIVSRMGFYVIVDKLYPLLCILSVLYYLIIFAFLPLYIRIKARKHTLKMPKGIKEQYLSLQDPNLKLDRRIQ